MVDDVLAREVAAWIDKRARRGLPVEAGTVVPTSSGALLDQGIRRIYHAAVVSPRTGTNEYDVDVHAIPRAVRNVLRLARQERFAHDPPLRSLCLPLFAAGRGGLDPAVSFAWTWMALGHELTRDDTWSVHLVTRRSSRGVVIVRHLLRDHQPSIAGLQG